MDPASKPDPAGRSLRRRVAGKVCPPTPPPKVVPSEEEDEPETEPETEPPAALTLRQRDPPGAPGPDPELKWHVNNIYRFYRVVEVAAKTGRYRLADMPATDKTFFRACVSSRTKKVKGQCDTDIKEIIALVHAEHHANKGFSLLLSQRLEWEEIHREERLKEFARKKGAAATPAMAPLEVKVVVKGFNYKAVAHRHHNFRDVDVQLASVKLPAPTGSPDSAYSFMPNGGELTVEGVRLRLRGMCMHAALLFNPIVKLSNDGHKAAVISLFTGETCNYLKAFAAETFARANGGQSRLSEAAVQNALACVYKMHAKNTKDGEVDCGNNMYNIVKAQALHSAIEVIYCTRCKRFWCRLVNVIRGKDAAQLQKNHIRTHSVKCVYLDCEEHAKRLRAAPVAEEGPVKCNRKTPADPARPALRRLRPNPLAMIVNFRLYHDVTIANLFRKAGFRKRIKVRGIDYIFYLCYFVYEIREEGYQKIDPITHELYYSWHAVALVLNRATDKFEVLDCNRSELGLQAGTTEEYASKTGRVFGTLYVRETEMNAGAAATADIRSLEQHLEDARREFQEDLAKDDEDSQQPPQVKRPLKDIQNLPKAATAKNKK